MTQRLRGMVLGVLVVTTAPLAGTQATPAVPSETSPSPSAPTGGQPPSAAPGFRVSVNAVQVDAVVTDEHGRRVTDLTADDFELLQDGKPQKIRTFRYEAAATPRPAGPPATTRAATPGAAAPPIPRETLRREDVRRSIAIVVDDLGLSFVSSARSRDAVKRFIDTSLQPGDVATIVRTSAGVGLLQQFTSDKALLHAAADRLRYSLLSRYRSDWAATMADENADDDQPRLTQEHDFRASVLAVGTLGAVNFVVRGMQDLPGRKAVVLVTDGFTLFRKNELNDRILTAVRRLIDAANRSFVVLYTLDAKGLVSLDVDASRQGFDRDPNARLGRLQDLWDSQGGPAVLAEATGGLALRNNNDISGALGRALDDQLGYYLLGFEPATDTFAPSSKAPRFHELTVRVRRKGLRVRARSGYFAITDAEYSRQNSMGSRLARALASPFREQRIGLRITPMFWLNEKGRPTIRAVTHLDAHALSFAPQAEGGFKSTFQIMGVAVDENGAVLSQSTQAYHVSARNEPSAQERADGFVYSLEVPVSDPGPYMFRVAVADIGSETVGSAQQFLVVPDLDRRRLLLSSIVLQQSTGCPEATAPCAAAALPADAGPALRRFTPPARLDLGFEVYHARVVANRPGETLTSTIRLFQEGREAFALPAEPIDLTARGPGDRISVGRTVRLGPALPPGDYQLQVTVTEQRPGKAPRRAVQWVDFSARAQSR